MEAMWAVFRVLLLFLLVVPTALGCKPPAGWVLYRDVVHGFELVYPAGGEVRRVWATVRIDLPFAPGTTLVEKYLLLEVGMPAGPSLAEEVWFDGRRWCLRRADEGAAGSVYEHWDWTTLLENGELLTITFVLRRANAGAFDVPPPEFDRERELMVFSEILLSFCTFAPLRMEWLNLSR